MRLPFFGKKKRPENAAVIDLGMLKAIEERTKAVKEAPFQNTGAALGPASGEGDFGFLGALASAAANDDSASPSSSTSSFSNTPVASSMDAEKLERLHRRIDHIIQRMELIERKIDRIEHRVDIKY